MLRRFEIIKYVQHMLTGGRHVHSWTHKSKMADFFLVTYDTEPLDVFVLRFYDQSATRTAIFTKLTCAPPFI